MTYHFRGLGADDPALPPPGAPLSFTLPASYYVLTYETGGPSSHAIEPLAASFQVIAREESGPAVYYGVRTAADLQYPYSGPPIWAATAEQAQIPLDYVAVADPSWTMQARIGGQLLDQLDVDQKQSLQNQINEVAKLSDAAAAAARDALRLISKYDILARLAAPLEFVMVTAAVGAAVWFGVEVIWPAVQTQRQRKHELAVARASGARRTGGARRTTRRRAAARRR